MEPLLKLKINEKALLEANCQKFRKCVASLPTYTEWDSAAGNNDYVWLSKNLQLQPKLAKGQD